MEKRLTADLNVVANSNLEIQLLDGDLNVIQKLDDEPNDVGGLTSAELKAKFDESGNIIKKYINETLIPAVLAEDATEESRKQAEAARVAAEQGRVTAEEGRVSAEAARAAAEQARSEAESSRVSAENARAQAETARASAEASRQANETARQNAESARQTAETNRAQAETARNVWEDYDSAKNYQPGNKVYWQGSSYVCLKPCSGISPENGLYWQLVVRSGFTSDSAFGFDVVNGRLLCYYSGDNPPPFRLGDDGHLYVDLDKTYDLGKVTGGSGSGGQEQLSGTTDELTPAQVYNAVSAGIPVKVQYTDSTYGILSFTAFNVAESLSVIVSQTIVYYKGVYILAELFGDSNGTWSFVTTTLAEGEKLNMLTDRVDAMQAAGYLTLATLPKYEGAAQ